MRYRFYTADIFTSQPLAGNQLAVFPHGGELDEQLMQRIAQEFNLSETAFVFPPQDPQHTHHVRIFTPGAELPFAGHPTVGTACVLALTGEVPFEGERAKVIFEEGVGPVSVAIQKRADQPIYAQLTAAMLPEFGPPPPPNPDLAAVLSLYPSDLLQGDYVPQAVSCGTPFLFVPLQNHDALSRARLNIAYWEESLAHYWAPEVFLFTFDTGDEAIDLRARMFAPAVGVSEDPATGAAATALAGYLGVRDATRDGMLHWVVKQGVEMGRPSTLYVEADKANGKITAIRVGGFSVLVSEGWMEIPL
jgi:trans-2,3-dihydro-3-hydroxyanthranilate isomerase